MRVRKDRESESISTAQTHTQSQTHPTQYFTKYEKKKREAPDRHTHPLWQIQDQQEPTNTYTKLRWGLLVVIEGINYEWIEPIIINYLLIASTLLSCYHCECEYACVEPFGW